MRTGGQRTQNSTSVGHSCYWGELEIWKGPEMEPHVPSLLRKAREKMMDASHSVCNGFSYQEKLSSKHTSVLEAVAGEYALVINGHSLVGPWECQAGQGPLPGCVP